MCCYCFFEKRIEGLNKRDLGENILSRRTESWRKTLVLHHCHGSQACIVFGKHISRLSSPFKVTIVRDREV